ncbi:hypothetical protein [Devosia sp.]|uniref:hypothetical protein n=1 Tax=Devosia sp. TaxID=1871048 RepID=UPI0025E70DF3|nr:hypothetical protein [Devosia sp.]MCR6633464.1 hypothetical protein [Devosia sp.]
MPMIFSPVPGKGKFGLPIYEVAAHPIEVLRAKGLFVGENNHRKGVFGDRNRVDPPCIGEFDIAASQRRQKVCGLPTCMENVAKAAGSVELILRQSRSTPAGDQYVDFRESCPGFVTLKVGEHS